MYMLETNLQGLKCSRKKDEVIYTATDVETQLVESVSEDFVRSNINSIYNAVIDHKGRIVHAPYRVHNLQQAKLLYQFYGEKKLQECRKHIQGEIEGLDGARFHYFLINELCKLLSDSNDSSTIETNYTDITVWMDIIAKYCNVNDIEIERTISIEVLENGGTYGNEDAEEDEDYIDSDDDDEVIDF